MANESATGNPVRVDHVAENATNCVLQATVSAEAIRDGDQVTITIKTTDIYWTGAYAQLSIDGLSEDNKWLLNAKDNDQDSSDYHEWIYTPKTLTYTQTGSKTYTFTLRTYTQWKISWKGYTYFDYLTITVPAATSKLWCVGTDGKWHAAKIYYSTSSAWKNAELYDTNHILT